MRMVKYKDYLQSTEYNNLKYSDIPTVKAYTGDNFKSYSTLALSFDIETSKVHDKDGNAKSFMYIWMVGIGDMTVYGRTWNELSEFLRTIKYTIIDTHQYIRDNNGNKHKSKVIFFGFIHNISFEWAFCKGNMIDDITDVFLKEKRQPLYFDMCGIKWIDSYQITRMSLDKLSKLYTSHHKLVGQLNYNIERSHKTTLTKKELEYCEHDVLVLLEYHRYYVNTYLKNSIKTFIYTQTGIVRAQLKQSFNKQRAISKCDITKMYPTTKLEYDIHMTYLFRGGYVHGRADMYGKILSNIDSFDITSAHPYQIVSKKFPMSPFVNIKVSRETFNIKDDYAYILDVTFTNIKSKTNHSIESLSKAMVKRGVRVDNGRINSAQELRVLLTDIDYKIYNMYYEWENITFNDVKISKKASLPRYVIENVLNAYETKEQLKLDGKSYMNEKVFLNSIFGSFVTKIYKYQYKYDCDTGVINKVECNYSSEVKKRILSMYWGIWTTAYTRLQQLELLQLLDGVYGDTDSNKALHNDYNFKIVESINNRIIKGNNVLCKRYHKNFDLVKEIGQWDYEGTYTRFKMLGAKRYVYEIDNKTHVTCAGLPKKVKLDNPFADFKDGMCVKNCKLATVYIDEKYISMVDGVEMQSQSGVSLVPCDFTISVANEYTHFIKWILEKISRETL